MIKNLKYFIIFLFLFGCGYSPIYEINQKLNQPVKNLQWPSVNEKYLDEEIINIVTQINGKKRKIFPIDKSTDKESLIEKIKNDDQIKKYINKKKIIKTIYIENKLINFIIK